MMRPPGNRDRPEPGSAEQVVARVSPPAHAVASAIEESRGWGHPRYNFRVAHPAGSGSHGQ